MTGRQCALLTGYPALRARFVLAAAAEQMPELSILALVHPERREEAEVLLASLDPHTARRVTLCEGDPAAMDFGLTGAEYSGLAARVDRVHAAYSVTDSAVSAEECERINLGAARELIEFGRASGGRLGILFYSSVFVSGNRSGRVLESELEARQSFRSAAERTLATAERMLRRSGLLVSVLRSGHHLGDATSGVVELFSGLYPLVVLLASMPEDSAIPLPPGADRLLPLTPLDRLAALGVFMASRATFGQTVQVLDYPDITLRRFLELCTERLGRGLSLGSHPTAWTRALLGNRAGRLLPHNARGVFEALTSPAEYDTREMLAFTDSGALRCHPLESYIGPLVEHVRARLQEGTFAAVRRPHGPWLIA